MLYTISLIFHANILSEKSRVDKHLHSGSNAIELIERRPDTTYLLKKLQNESTRSIQREISPFGLKHNETETSLMIIYGNFLSVEINGHQNGESLL